MRRLRSKPLGLAVVLVAGIAVSGPVFAAEMPPSMNGILKKLGLTPDILKNSVNELAVPAAWVAAAKKEGTLRVRLNLAERNFNKLVKPFSERYPFIEVEFTRAVGADRAVKPLLAFKSGRYIADITMGISGKFTDYLAADAMEDLRPLPSWSKIPEPLRHPKGYFGAYGIVNWCTSYNVNKVKKSELPKTWSELIRDPKWRNGRVGSANRPQLWLINIWGAKGEKYAKNLMGDFFSTLKPQLRKEAINGMMKLASIGEVDLAMPSAGYRVKLQVERGAPIAFHCPEPVPTAAADVVVFKGGPRVNSAKIFVNWLMSIEGQLALNAADGTRPSHVDLATLASVMPFPEAVQGKKLAYRTLDLTLNQMKPMFKAWNKSWLAAGGPARKKRKKR
jgi:ABC-type Fe3+ transport system substrate-binding protein